MLKSIPGAQDSHDGVFLLNRAGRVTWCNALAARVLGVEAGGELDRDLALRRGLFLADGSTPLTLSDSPLAKVLEDREAREFEVCVRGGRSEAETDWLNIRAEPVHPTEAVIVTCRDIAGPGRVRDALRTSEQRLRRLMDSGIIGIAFWDREGVITEANDAWLRTIGRGDREPWPGAIPGWEAATAPESADLLRQAIGQIAARGTCDPFESLHLTPGGECIPVLTGGASLEGGGGLTFALDIGERKRLEEKLRQAARLESVGILAGGIAHDFNNLLTGVLANATLAIEDAAPGSRQAELLRSVVRAAERAADLTQQMLAYSGRGSFQLEYVDVAALIAEILMLMEAVAGRNVALRLEGGGALPSVEADPAQLHQVAMNLVINAAESIEGAGQVSVRTGIAELDGEPHADDVSIGASPVAGRFVFLEVRDTGRGMDGATLRRIFDPFFTTKFTGRGLGLASVLGIVRGHRGLMRVRSAPGQGTVFTVFLPASDHEVTYPQPRDRAAAGPGAGIVLVVDDEEYVRETVRRTLESVGYTVVCASGLKDALQLFRALAPQIDVALVDMTMPEEDGDEVARRLRHFDPNLKVIATSGYPEAEVRGRFGDLMDAFLPKPWRAERLRELVSEVLAVVE